MAAEARTSGGRAGPSVASLEALPVGSRVVVSARDRNIFLETLQIARDRHWQLIALPSYWDAARAREVCDRYEAHAWLRPGYRDEPSVQIVAASTYAASNAPPGLVVFTSGTTGAPKGILHDWTRLMWSATFAARRLARRTWLLAYEPASFAGVQVCMSALASQGRLVIPPQDASMAEQARLLVGESIEVVSATPTWWRLLLTSWPLDLPRPQLHQITLGGEPIDQGILDALQDAFAPNGLTHIYASSEVGTAIVVSDRRAGFPVSVLDRRRGAQLRIVDGALQVRSPFRMERYLSADESVATDDGWIDTGDLVEVRGERCFFTGRRDQRINIGGMKIAAEEIEGLLLSYPGVHDCLVYGRRNPITGMLLAADIVPSNPTEFDSHAFAARLRSELPRHLTPQHLRVVERLVVSPNGKKRRV